MPKQYELDQTYMGVDLLHSKLSKAKRKQVGSCLITTQGSIVPGVNGLPNGMSNTCEDAMWNTKQEVLHAELSSIIRCARNGISCIGSVLYVTLSPCIHCASLIIQSGIKEVVFLEKYRNEEGIGFLKEAGIMVRQITLEN